MANTESKSFPQAAQYPSGPATVRHDCQLSEHRQGEGALQGEICSAQQPAGLPGRPARLDSGGSVCVLPQFVQLCEGISLV